MDNLDPTPHVTCYPSTLPLAKCGTTVVTCTARDECGNVSSCSFTVTVQDLVPPVLHCPTGVTNCTCYGEAQAFFSVTATDNCDPNLTIVCRVQPSGSVVQSGT